MTADGDVLEMLANGGTKTKEAPRRMESIGRQYTKEIVIGTDQDPFNKPELVHTLKGRELCFFVIFYAFAVSAIVLMFELLKPVLFNPNYPDNE